MAELKLQTAPLEPQFASGSEVGFFESVGAGNTEAFELGNVAAAQRHSEIYGGWTGLFTSVSQGSIDLPEDLQKSLFESGFQPDESTLSRLSDWVQGDGKRFDLELTEDMAPDRVAERREAVTAAARSRVEEAQAKLERGSAFGGFVGAVGAEFVDPLNIATLPVGASGRAGILATAAIEAGINAVIEGLDTTSRNAIARELDQPESGILGNVIRGAAFGAVAGGGIRAIQKGAPPAAKAAARLTRSGVSALSGLIRRPSDRRALGEALLSDPDPNVSSLARQVIEDAVEAEAATAGGRQSADSLAEHESRLEETARALERGEEPQMPDRPVSAVPRGSILNGELEEVDPRELTVDPETFQFKSEATGAQGLTDKLKDVPAWRSERAGVVLVYESADGTRFIADGHQRTGLARRIMEQDPAQEIRLAARVFREADGFTTLQVREIAALKNIAEAADGMTTKMARDAAKVLRINPANIRELPAGPGIARAQNLTALSDDAFALVVNDVVPDRFAAVVGRLVKDQVMHMPIMRLLERTKPSTEAQAEAIVRQALAAPVSREVTEDLFGTSEQVESLFLERAKVLERTMRTLRDDERTFRTLTERGETIEGRASNKLDAAGNAENRKRIEEAMAAIEKLAYRAGPVSEALDNGAKSYRETGRLGDAASAVVSAINDELERNGLSGLGAGPSGRAAESARANAESLDPNAEFGEPNGAGADAQIANTRILDANERPAEGFSSDEEARRDLGRRVSAGASREELDAHPAVVKALAELKARAAEATNLRETYGSPEWHQTREYVFGDEVVVGTDEALPRWVAQAEAFAGGPVRREARVTIVLGPPAAGKSTIAEDLAKVKGAAILDSDEIKQTLPEFEGGIGSAAVHEESSDLADRLEAALRATGANIVFPKVGGSPGSIRKAIDRFKADGYTVEIVNMAVSTENAYKRMIGRFVAKGRLIPPEYVDDVGEKPSATYRTLKDEGKADGFAEIDNNGGFGDPKPILDRAGSENPLAGSSYDLPESRGEGLQSEPARGGPDQGNDPRREPELEDRQGATGDAAQQVEQTPAGSQLLIDGVAPITARDRVQTAADRPLLAPTRTTDSEIGGLFDANDPARSDLFDMVPVGIREEDGVMRAEIVSRADLAAELDGDDQFAEVISLCLR